MLLRRVLQPETGQDGDPSRHHTAVSQPTVCEISSVLPTVRVLLVIARGFFCRATSPDSTLLHSPAGEAAS